MGDDWDAHSGACLQPLEGHNNRVNSAAFSHNSSRVASTSDDKTIKIWDTHSGACLQTLNIGTVIYILSFDLTGLSLYTNIGIVALDSPTIFNTALIEASPLELQGRQDAQEPQKPQYQGYGVRPGGVWITRNSQNWLWLPSEYRPVCSAVARSGLALALGCASGRVLIFGFSTSACD